MRRAALVVMVLTACSHGPQRSEPSPVAVSLQSHVPGESASYLPAGAYTSEMERCIDRELAERKLNDFGDPLGTTYPPGAPVLAITTRTDRYRHVMKRRPDIATTCTRALGEPLR